MESKMPAFAIGLSPEIERNPIIRRRKKAWALKKAGGVVWRHSKRRRKYPEKYKLYGKQVLTAELLKEGLAKRAIAKVYKVGYNTLTRLIAEQADETLFTLMPLLGGRL